MCFCRSRYKSWFLCPLICYITGYDAVLFTRSFPKCHMSPLTPSAEILWISATIIIQCVPLATEPGLYLIILPCRNNMAHYRHIPLRFSHNEPYSCSNFVAISSMPGDWKLWHKAYLWQGCNYVQLIHYVVGNTTNSKGHLNLQQFLFVFYTHAVYKWMLSVRFCEYDLK